MNRWILIALAALCSAESPAIRKVQQTLITEALDSSETAIDVRSTSDFPDDFPYAGLIQCGTTTGGTFEAVSITAAPSSTQFTVTRSGSPITCGALSAIIVHQITAYAPLTSGRLCVEGGTCTSSGAGSGDDVEINAVGVTDGVNFNDTTPAAPTDGVNTHWQRSGTSNDNASSYIDTSTGTGDAARSSDMRTMFDSWFEQLHWIQTTGSGTDQLGGAWTLSGGSSMTGQTPSEGQQFSFNRRSSTTGVLAVAGWVHGGTTQCMVSSTARAGGCHAFFRWSLGSNTSGSKLIAGLTTTSPVGGTEPSAHTNAIFVGWDSTDLTTGNLYLMHNDNSGTATRQGLGPATARGTGDTYELLLLNEPGSLNWRVVLWHRTDGVLVTDQTVSTNTPIDGATIGGSLWCAKDNASPGSGACIVDNNLIYLRHHPRWSQ